MRKPCLLAAATYLLAAAPLQANPIAITDVMRYSLNDFPQYAATEDGLTLGRVYGDPIRVLGSYLATSDTPLSGFTFTVDPSLMPGTNVWSTVALCLGGAWGPPVAAWPTCSSGMLTGLSLGCNAAQTYDAATGRYGLDFSGITAGAVAFDPVLQIGVLTRVSSSYVELAYSVYSNQLRADGVPPPYYGPGWVTAEQRFLTGSDGIMHAQAETIASIPEPATTALLLVSVGMVAALRRRGTI